MPGRRIVSRLGRSIVSASGRTVTSGGGTVAVATQFALSLSPSSGLIGSSATLTATPVSGVWPSGRTLAITQSVSLFTVGSFSQPAAGTATAVSIPLTVASSGGPSSINVTDSGTSPMTSTGSQTYTASSGGGTTPTLIQSFALTNNNASGTSPGFHRGGVPFAKGDVPAGTALQIKRGSTVIDAQFDERVTWTDGSLKYAVMHLRDTTFSSSEARTYNVWTVPSTAFNNTSTLGSAYIGTLGSYKVCLYNVKQSATVDGSNGDLTTVGSGQFWAILNNHKAVTTRVEQVHSGPVCEGWTVWGMFTDANVGGSPADAHLKAVWHIDVWKNADGTFNSEEVGAVVTQDWWSVAGKQRRQYDACLAKGVGYFIPGGGSPSILIDFLGVVHPYHSQWLTAHTTGLNRGKRQWQAFGGPADPTLQYTFSKTYWAASKVIPPYDPTITPNAYTTINSATDPYAPCTNQNHRYEFNVAGGYEGRGVITNTDAVAFMRQTAADTACARVSALVGLHVPFHRRSNRTRTRPIDSGVSDTANTIVALKLDVGKSGDVPPTVVVSLPSYDFTSVGLPIPVDAYSYNIGVTQSDGYTQPGGYMWPWLLSQPYSSHRPNYSFYMYLVEGERYLLESILDLAMAATQDGPDAYNESFMDNLEAGLGGRNTTTWNQTTRPAGEVANIINGPVKAWPFRGEERDFNSAIVGSAVGIVPGSHVASGYFKRWQQSLDVGMDAFRYAMPPDHVASGFTPYLSNPCIDDGANQSPWMAGMTCLGHLHAAALTESTSQLAFANHYAKQAIGMWNNQPGSVYSYGNPYRWRMKAKSQKWHLTNNPYLPWGETLLGAVQLTAAHFVANQAAQYWVGAANLHVGDKLYWQSQHYDGDNNDPPASPPGGVTEGTAFYVKTHTGVTGDDATLTLSLSPGGADFVFTTFATAAGANSGAEWWFNGPSWAWGGPNATAGQAGGGDTYGSILRAVLIHAKALGNSTATQTLVDRANFLLDNNWSSYAAWKYA